MPRASKAAAARNHAAIERASSRLLRGQGLHVSVADVMAAVPWQRQRRPRLECNAGGRW